MFIPSSEKFRLRVARTAVGVATVGSVVAGTTVALTALDSAVAPRPAAAFDPGSALRVAGETAVAVGEAAAPIGEGAAAGAEAGPPGVIIGATVGLGVTIAIAAHDLTSGGGSSRPPAQKPRGDWPENSSSQGDWPGGSWGNDSSSSWGTPAGPAQQQPAVTAPTQHVPTQSQRYPAARGGTGSPRAPYVARQTPAHITAKRAPSLPPVSANTAQDLRSLGYTGPNAVRNFQNAFGLSPDGSAGALTRAHIEANLAAARGAAVAKGQAAAAAQAQVTAAAAQAKAAAVAAAQAQVTAAAAQGQVTAAAQAKAAAIAAAQLQANAAAQATALAATQAHATASLLATAKANDAVEALAKAAATAARAAATVHAASPHVTGAGAPTAAAKEKITADVQARLHARDGQRKASQGRAQLAANALRTSQGGFRPPNGGSAHQLHRSTIRGHHEALQLNLQRMGVYTGSIDGEVGPATEHALATVQWAQHRLGVAEDGNPGPVTEAAAGAYQARHGLKVTGTLNRRTLESLSRTRPEVHQATPDKNVLPVANPIPQGGVKGTQVHPPGTALPSHPNGLPQGPAIVQPNKGSGPDRLNGTNSTHGASPASSAPQGRPSEDAKLEAHERALGSGFGFALVDRGERALHGGSTRGAAPGTATERQLPGVVSGRKLASYIYNTKDVPAVQTDTVARGLALVLRPLMHDLHGQLELLHTQPRSAWPLQGTEASRQPSSAELLRYSRPTGTQPVVAHWAVEFPGTGEQTLFFPEGHYGTELAMAIAQSSRTWAGQMQQDLLRSAADAVTQEHPTLLKGHTFWMDARLIMNEAGITYAQALSVLLAQPFEGKSLDEMLTLIEDNGLLEDMARSGFGSTATLAQSTYLPGTSLERNAKGGVCLSAELLQAMAEASDPEVSTGLGCPLVRRGVPVVQQNGLFAGMGEGAVHQGASDFIRLLRAYLPAAE